MADGVAISQLNSFISNLNGTEEFPIARAGETYKVTTASLTNYFEAALGIADILADSVNWQQTYLSYNSKYQTWDDTRTTVQVHSGDWEEAYDLVNDLISLTGNYITRSTNNVSSITTSWVLDEDNFSSNSNTKVPTQQSVKAYVDGLVTGVFTLQGNYNISTNTPSLTGTTTGISSGDAWIVQGTGFFYNRTVENGDVLIATTNNPSALSGWSVIDNVIDLTDADKWNSTYETVSTLSATWATGGGPGGGTVQDGLSLKIKATNDGLVAGNVRGSHSVDLQTGRFNANEVASGQYSTIVGGYANRAAANYSVALGYRAQAIHPGSFVFADDNTITSFSSLSAKTFNIRAENGLRLITDGSQVAGQVLTCDATGHGKWQSLPSAYAADLQEVTDNGNVTTNTIHVSAITTGNNIASGLRSSAVGGDSNRATNINTTVIGGVNGLASGENSNTTAGIDLSATGNQSAAVAGIYNIASAPYSIVAGGSSNYIDPLGLNAGILAGVSLSATASKSAAVGGQGSRAAGEDSATLGGENHVVTHDRSVAIGGSGLVSDAEDTVYVPNLNVSGTLTWPGLNIDSSWLFDATSNIPDVSLAAGEFRTNNSSPGSVTNIYYGFQYDTIDDYLTDLNEGDYLFIQDNSGTEHLFQLTTSPYATGSYWTLEVSYVEGNVSGSTNFTDNDNCSIRFLTIGGGSDRGVVLDESSNPSVPAIRAREDYSGSVAGKARGVEAVDLQLKRGSDADIAGGNWSTIVGGHSNEISDANTGGNGQYASIMGGGFNNVVKGQYGSILGGYLNQIGDTGVDANYSVACGSHSRAKHNHTFVFNDSPSVYFDSLQANTFNIHAANGLRLITDGNQAAGQVLTCDSNGHGTWQDGYGDSDVATYLNGNLSTHVIPSSSEAYDLGSATYKFRHLYLSNSTIYMGTSSTPISLHDGKLTVGGDIVAQSPVIQSIEPTLSSYEAPNPYVIDLAQCINGELFLTSNISLQLSGAEQGQSGMITIGNGKDHAGVGFTVDFYPDNLSTQTHSEGGHSVMAGDLADFATTPLSGEYNYGTIAWYYTGTEYLLYVSEVKPFTTSIEPLSSEVVSFCFDDSFTTETYSEAGTFNGEPYYNGESSSRVLYWSSGGGSWEISEWVSEGVSVQQPAEFFGGTDPNDPTGEFVDFSLNTYNLSAGACP